MTLAQESKATQDSNCEFVTMHKQKSLEKGIKTREKLESRVPHNRVKKAKPTIAETHSEFHSPSFKNIIKF